jgi:hypothetical protein
MKQKQPSIFNAVISLILGVGCASLVLRISGWYNEYFFGVLIFIYGFVIMIKIDKSNYWKKKFKILKFIRR